MQKPPVDIEWYEDGFTMEEQAELRRQFIKKEKASRPKISVTGKQQENWKDALISELKMKLAANEEYIQELEEHSVHPNKYAELEAKYQELQKKYDSLKTSHNAYVKRYESDIEVYFKSKYQDKLDEIKALKAERKELIANRDSLIYKLHKATDGQRIS
jgi:hypothetical protein